MVPTRKMSELKVKLIDINEIEEFMVFKISREHPDKRESSKKEAREWWAILFPEKMGDRKPQWIYFLRESGLSLQSKEERML